MQLALSDKVFLVDLASPTLASHLDALFQVLFSDDQTLIVGFAFHNDIRELRRSRWSPMCQFNPQSICDLQIISGGGNRECLSSLVRRTIGSPLCKAEQRSYWHRRPLRAAQRHYAALDAYVELQVASALVGVQLNKPVDLACAL